MRYRFILATLCIALAVHAEEVKVEEQTHGCLVSAYDNGNSTPVFDFFVKVANKEYPSDDGKAEIWGYIPPGPPEKDRNGYYIYRNALEERFIPAGRAKSVLGHPCHCPSW